MGTRAKVESRQRQLTGPDAVRFDLLVEQLVPVDRYLDPVFGPIGDLQSQRQHSGLLVAERSGQASGAVRPAAGPAGLDAGAMKPRLLHIGDFRNAEWHVDITHGIAEQGDADD